MAESGNVKSANLFDEPLGRWPIYPMHHLLSDDFRCEGVSELLIEPMPPFQPQTTTQP